LNAAAVAVALIAAVAFGASTALMYHSASQLTRPDMSLVRLIARLVVQPRWLAGMAASLAGLALHALALRLGSLAVVQPLVVTGLVFAFVFRALLDRRMPPTSLVAWVIVTAVGIAIFLVGSRSVISANEPSGRAAVVLLIVGGSVAALAWWAADHVGRRRAGLLLGLAGGVVFGMIAGVLKAVTASAGLADLFTTWPLYVLVALGATGFTINQHAYSSAPLASSLPVLDVVNPIVAVIFGVVVFDEHPGSNPGTLAAEAIGLLLVLAGISFLARAEEDDPRPGRQRPPGAEPRDTRLAS
jgi:drug/metabolite transporter (DMT)-like permease